METYNSQTVMGGMVIFDFLDHSKAVPIVIMIYITLDYHDTSLHGCSQDFKKGSSSMDWHEYNNSPSTPFVDMTILC